MAGEEPTPQRVVAALRRAGIAEVDGSTRRRAEYSTDASLYRVVPAAVVYPRDTDEVAAILDVCRATGVPLTARGAGTSIAGNAVGPGVVADFSRHLTSIRAVDAEARTADVAPGVVLRTLQRRVAAAGLRFGPDPSTHTRCTLGGMIGNNSCGAHALAYGRTADNVVELDVLTGTGERLTARRGTAPAPARALSTLDTVVRDNLNVIRTELGRFNRQVSGYSLEHLLPEHGFDVAKALVGTEGTCVVLLGARVRLVPLPAATTLVVLGYPDLATAADAVPALLPHRPVAVEGLDHRIPDVVRQRRGASAVPPLPAGDAWLFVELAGESAGAVAASAAALVRDAGAADSRVVPDAAQAATLWRIREDGAGLSSRSPAGLPAYPGWEDAAVPPARLGAYLREFDALLAERGLTGTPYGHFGDGCVHVRIDFPLSTMDGRPQFRRFLTDAATLVASHGGTMSGEHGDGRARSDLLPLMYSPAALAAFARVKDAFDPDGVLNPGVVVRPVPVDADLRRPSARAVPAAAGGFRYGGDFGDFTTAVHRCVGVGKCISDTDGVMCPSYLATRDEKDSTRGRARVLQEMLNGGLVTGGWRAAEVHESLDLCLACKGCASDCPAGVDMATYKAEVLHRRYAGRLRPRAHYALGWLPRWAALAARAPRLANAVLRARPLAATGRWLAGVDRRRPLPALAPRTFRQWYATNRPQGTGDPVLLWVDTFTNHFAPHVGVAAVRVLSSAGFDVRIPDRPVCCGLTWISTGQLDKARAVLRRSLAVVAAAGGMPVVGLEPSCTAALRADAPDLLGETIAVRTVAELLADRPQWTPPDLTGTEVLAQPHCHHHAVLGWAADRDLLTRAGARVTTVAGCCGLAGNFGMERGHYDVSVAVARNALLPAVGAAAAGTVLLADGFSCRTQLDHLAHRSARHLVELLAAGQPGGG